MREDSRFSVGEDKMTHHQIPSYMKRKKARPWFVALMRKPWVLVFSLGTVYVYSLLDVNTPHVLSVFTKTSGQVSQVIFFSTCILQAKKVR